MTRVSWLVSVFAKLHWQTLPILPIVAVARSTGRILCAVDRSLRLLACAAPGRRRSAAARSPRAFRRLPDRYPLGDSARAARVCYPLDLPRELNKTTIAEYRVEPGDGLLILPHDLESKIRLPADQTVLADGTIDLGKYGRLYVAGKSVAEIEKLVQARSRRRRRTRKSASSTSGW